jgi:integrase
MIMASGTGHFRDLAEWTGTTPKQLVDTHLAKTPNTARGYREDLAAIAAWLDCGKGDKALAKAVVRLVDNGRSSAKRLLIGWINDMRGKCLSANTIRRRVASVVSMIATAADLDIIVWQVGRLANLPPAVRVRNCQGPDLAMVKRMFAACRERWDIKGARDEAMLGLMYWHALRATEVLSIQMGDVDLPGRTVRIVAKRGQGRMTLHLCQLAAKVVGRWVELRGGHAGPLFSRCCHWGGKVTAEPLTYWGLRGVVRNLGVVAGGRCWPHGLRHAAISHLASLTGDSPLWGCAFSRHRDVRAWSMYQDRSISHVSAAEVLSRGQIVRRDPKGTDN